MLKFERLVFLYMIEGFANIVNLAYNICNLVLLHWTIIDNSVLSVPKVSNSFYKVFRFYTLCEFLFGKYISSRILTTIKSIHTQTREVCCLVSLIVIARLKDVSNKILVRLFVWLSICNNLFQQRCSLSHILRKSAN